MKLAYRAFEKTGREVTDVIEAASPEEAAERLRRRDVFVADIAPASEAPARGAPTEATEGRRRLRWPVGRSRRLKNLAMFTRQLHVLLRAGTPLAEALRTLEQQAKDPAWHRAVSDVRRRLEQGTSLAGAMEARGDYFDAVYRNMVSAGETSGKLTAVLDRLAVLIRKRLHIRQTVVSAMVYPTLLITVSLSVLGVMLTMVIPRFSELFGAMGVPLPPTTAILLNLSQFMRSYWPAVLGGLVAAGFGWRYFLRTPLGRRFWDTLTLKLPYIGGLARSFATAQIARLLGVLLDSHLPILEALGLTRNTLTNVHYTALLQAAEDAVRQGRPISSAFRGSDLISPSVYEATRSGEQSGQVSPLLLDLADFLDEENEMALRGLISILEPTILIIMGLLVGFVALSIFTPLFDATSLTGGGVAR